MPATLSSPSNPAMDAAAADGADVPPSLMRFRDRVRARSGMAELLAFRVGAERYAFDVRALDEALDAPPIDRVAAHETSILAGLLRLSGMTIPVFDAGRLLCAGASRGEQVLVLRSASRRMALLVDDVDDVVTFDLGAVRPPPCEASDDLLLGVVWDGASLTSILDARAIVSACQQRPTGGSA